MTFGGIVLLALIITIVVVCVKVRNNSRKIQELDEILDKYQR